MCRTIFARVVAGMRHCKQLRPLPLTSYKFLNTETPNRLVCQHLLSRFRFCHPSSKTEYKYEAFSLHNISRGFVSEATDMVDIVSDPKFSHSSQSRELVPHKTRKEVSPVEDPEDIIPSHEPGSSPVMFRIVERPRGLDEKESGKRPAGFVPHGVLRTPRKMQPSRRFQPRVVDKDGNRILDIGGFLSHAISLLPKEKPVKTVLAGEKVSPSVLNEVLQNLRRRKYFSRVKEVLLWALERGAPKLTVKHFSVAISACRDASDASSALEIFNIMTRSGVVLDTVAYGAMLSACDQVGDWELAGVMHRRMLSEGVAANETTYTSLISACAKAGECSTAERYFAEMQEAGIPPNTITYTALISACTSAGMWERALELYEAMKTKSVGINQFTTSNVIRACGKAGQLDKAIDVYKEMSAMGIVADTVTYSSLISAFEKVGDLDRAMLIYEEMKQTRSLPNLVTFSTLISTCEKAGDWTTALSLYETMRSQKIEPNLLTFTSLILALAKGGQVDLALDMFAEMKNLGIHPDYMMISLLVESSAKRRDWPQLAVFVQELESTPMADRKLYNMLINILWNSGRKFDAVHFLLKAIENGLYIDAAKPQRNKDGQLRLDLHGLSVGAAKARTAMWLVELQGMLMEGRTLEPHMSLALVTGRGLHSSETVEGSLLTPALLSWLGGMDSPFEVDPDNPGALLCTWSKAEGWVAALQKNHLLEQLEDNQDMQTPESEQVPQVQQ